jgi:hypothetical protein
MDHDTAGRPAAGILDERSQTRQLDISPMQHVATVPRITGPPALFSAAAAAMAIPAL